MSSSKQIAVGTIVVILAFVAVGCRSTTGRSFGQQVDDKSITSQVKARLAADRFGSLFSTGVGTQFGVVHLSGNVATYQGLQDYYGSDSFTYAVSDGQLSSAPCTVSVTVNPVNDAPHVVIEVQNAVDIEDVIPGIVLITGNGRNECAILDGSGTTDVEGDAIVSYVWLVNGEEVGEGAILDACLAVGDNIVTLRADDGQDVGEGSVTVQVVTACDAVEALIMAIHESGIEQAMKRPWIASLKTASSEHERGQTQQCIRTLKAVQRKMESNMPKRYWDLANKWYNVANLIIEALNGNKCEVCAEQDKADQGDGDDDTKPGRKDR